MSDLLAGLGEGLFTPLWEALPENELPASSSTGGAAEARVDGMVLLWPKRSNMEGAVMVTAEEADKREALGEEAPEVVKEVLCCNKRLGPGALVTEENEVEA